jgi:hypothetical protein
VTNLFRSKSLRKLDVAESSVTDAGLEGLELAPALEFVHLGRWLPTRSVGSDLGRRGPVDGADFLFVLSPGPNAMALVPESSSEINSTEDAGGAASERACGAHRATHLAT